MTRWVLGHRITPQEVTGDFDLVLGETPSNTQGPPPHFHNSFHEVFLVTEGEMEFMVDGEVQSVTAGQSVSLPPQSVHTFSNNSDHPCKWVNIHSPKGFLTFFENLGVPESQDNAAKRSVDGKLIQEVVETASQYDMIIKAE